MNDGAAFAQIPILDHAIGMAELSISAAIVVILVLIGINTLR